MHVVIVYDISCNSSRSHVFRILRELGINTQRSVFECELSASEIRELLDRLSGLITPETDSLLMYPMCRHCASGVHIIGQGTAFVHAEWEVI